MGTRKNHFSEAVLSNVLRTNKMKIKIFHLKMFNFTILQLAKKSVYFMGAFS